MFAKSMRRRGPLLFLAAATMASLFPLTLAATTKEQVDKACASSSAALQEYRAAQKSFEEAALAYEAVLNDIAIVKNKKERAANTTASHNEELEKVNDQLAEQAVELYMQSGLTSPLAILSASPTQALTTSEMLAAAATGGQATIDELIAAKNELGRFSEDLDIANAELEALEVEKSDIKDLQESAMSAEQAAYAKLEGECKRLAAKRQAEIEIARANAPARARGSVQVGPFICPFTRGHTSFINSWGFPRSGGRTHKGVDMFASWNEPMYAVAPGRVSVGNSGLGGKTIWLISDSGAAFYYAHLAGWNVSNGQRVNQGATIGYNGDSGNARGGAPHLHFEIHPGGRGSAAVNPYPTVAAVCR